MARLAIIHCESGDMREVSSYGGASMVSTSGLDMQGNYCLKCTEGAYAYKNHTSLGEGYYQFLVRPTYYSATLLRLYLGAEELFSLTLGEGIIKARKYYGVNL